jgi:hypothetical protein
MNQQLLTGAGRMAFTTGRVRCRDGTCARPSPSPPAGPRATGTGRVEGTARRRERNREEEAFTFWPAWRHSRPWSAPAACSTPGQWRDAGRDHPDHARGQSRSPSSTSVRRHQLHAISRPSQDEQVLSSTKTSSSRLTTKMEAYRRAGPGPPPSIRPQGEGQQGGQADSAADPEYHRGSP